MLAAACAGCLLFGGVARAGFTWGSGGDLVFGGTPIGSGKATDDIDSTKKALIDSGKAANDKQATELVIKMQATLRGAMLLVRGKDKDIYDALKGIQGQGRMDVDFQKTQATDQEGSTVRLADKNGVEFPLVNIKAPLLLPPDGTSDLTDQVSLGLTLYHEGIHVGQDEPALKETDPQRKKAEFRRNLCVREIEAHGKELQLIDELEKAIKSLQANPDFVPGDDVSGFTKQVISKLKGLEPDPRKGQIEKLLKELDRQSIGGTLIKNRYESACAAYNAFLKGEKTWDQLKKDIADFHGGASTVFTPLQKIVYVPSGGLVLQLADTGNFPLETPFRIVLDVHPLPTRHLLLVSGRTGDGLGAVDAFRDVNHDGIYDQGTLMPVVPPTTALQNGLQLFDRGDGAQSFVWDVASEAIYRLDDRNGDGVPDTLGPNIAAGIIIPDDFVALLPAPNGTLYGFENPLDTVPSFTGNEQALVLHDTDGDGIPDEADVAPFTDALTVEPIVLPPLDVGATTAQVQMTAGSDFWVLAVDRTTGYVNDLVGTGFASSLAPVSVNLDRPLKPDEGLVVHDFTHDLIGQATLVTPPGPDVHVTLTPASETIGTGETADFRLLIANDGRATAHGITVSGTLPPVVPWQVDDPRCTIALGALSCSAGDLAPGDDVVIHITTQTDESDCGGALFVIAGAKAADSAGEETSGTIEIDCSGGVAPGLLGVVSSRPADGRRDVPVTTTVNVRFDAMVQPASVNSDTVTLQRPDGTRVPASVSYDSGSREAVLTPDSPLAGGSSYYVFVQQVRNLFGLPLGGQLLTRFETAAIDTRALGPT